MMCYYLNVHFQGQRVKVLTAVLLKLDTCSVVTSCRLACSYRRVECSSTEVKNEWSCTSTSPNVVMACTWHFYQRW